jgi:hypothetical protein
MIISLGSLARISQWAHSFFLGLGIWRYLAGRFRAMTGQNTRRLTSARAKVRPGSHGAKWLRPDKP